MTESVYYNAIALISQLPHHSALKWPLMYHLLRGVDVHTLAKALDMPLNTVKRYVRHVPDQAVLFLAEKPHVKRPRGGDSAGLEAAQAWLREECGTTQSGRTLVVKRTPLTRTGLHQEYCSRTGNAIGWTLFMRACVLERVHFRVGPVDAFTCVLCRQWESDIEKLNEEDSPRAEKERSRLLRLQADHVALLSKQRDAYLKDLERVRESGKFVVITLDFSSITLMGRDYVSDLGVVVCKRGSSGDISRSYHDLIGLQASGRRRDVVFYLFRFLLDQGVLKTGYTYCVWTDSGSSDFHNAGALFGFAFAAHLLQEKGIVLESFNFFGARHGWNDADRHFGAISRTIDHWLAYDAPNDLSLHLDVEQLMRLLRDENRIKNTTPHDCRHVQFPGIDYNSVAGLTACFSFEPGPEAPFQQRDGKYVATISAKVYSESSAGVVKRILGSFLLPEDATKTATARVAKREAAEAARKRKKAEEEKK